MFYAPLYNISSNYTKSGEFNTITVTIDKLQFSWTNFHLGRARVWRIEGNRPWADSKNFYPPKLCERIDVTPLTSSFRLAFRLYRVFLTCARAFVRLLACSRGDVTRGAFTEGDRICEMAVYEGWISDEVIRGGSVADRRPRVERKKL